MLTLLLPLAGRAQDVVISQLYPAGGNAGATYNRDFVELFNQGNTTATLTNWSIQYASATGAFSASASGLYTFSATIPAGGYLLIGVGPASSTNGVALPVTPDLISASQGFGGTAGKVALANNATPVTFTAPNTFSANTVDFVGYGATANAYEGAGRAAAPSTTTALFRAAAGCTDSDNNSTDFALATPAPRNSSTAPNPCAAPVAPTLDVTQGGTAYANNGTAYDFGNQVQFTTGSPVSFTLTNNGPDALTISSITTTGDFSVSGASPTTVAANGGTASVSVTFTPMGTGTRNGTLVINSNATNASAYTVNLTGNGDTSMTTATLEVSQNGTAYASGGAPYVFGSQTVNTTSGAVAFTLTNTGPDPLSVAGITTTGNFAITGAVPSTVPGNNGTATVNVTFTPTAAGTRTGTLVITSNSTTGLEYTVNLQGEGVLPAPTLTAISPASVIGGATYNVTLTGTNFGTTAGTTVNFNGGSIVPSFINASGTSLTVALPVPATAGSYPVSVTTASGTSGAQSLTVTAPMAGFYEPFEPGTQNSYATAAMPATVSLRTGSYTFVQALLGSTAGSDKFNNIQGARIRGGGFIAMNTDKPNGAGIVTLSAAMYGSETGATFTVEYSTDGGVSYLPATAGVPTSLTGTLTPYTITVNVPGPIRLRIGTSNTTAGSNPRINIDDLQIADYTGPAANPQIAVSQGATPVASGDTFSGFATTMTGSTSPAVTFTITNSSMTDALSISGFSASGSEFVTSGTNPTSVAAGGTETFSVVFRPSGTGNRTGSITINNNSTGSPAYVLNFSATGTPFVAQPFTAGNLVVTRVGSGSSSLSSTATPVFLDEYTTSASQTNTVQSIGLPTTDENGNQTLTVTGNSTTVGALSRSIDGQYLTVAGYDAPVGATLPGTAAAVNRTVARIGIDASMNVTTALTDAYSGGDVRSVTTTSGTNLWLAGSTEGIRHTTTGATTSTVVSSNVTNNRVVNVFETKVYYSTGSGTSNRGIWMVNGDFPTTAGAGSTQIVATGNSSDPYGFVMLNRSEFVPGLDVLYVVDAGGQLLKYSKSVDINQVVTWTARGSRTIPTGARGLTGRVSNGVAMLYFNTATTLYATTDATDASVAISGAAAVTPLATAPANTAFRGVSFAPEELDLVASGDLDDTQIIVDGGAYRDIYADQGRMIKSVGALSARRNVVVQGSNATLDTGCNPLTGTASFTIQNDGIGDGGGLVICNPAGLSLTGATGQIQVTGTRNYGNAGSFFFVNPSNAAQVTGPGFPLQVGQIYTGSAGGVTLSRPLSVRNLVQLAFSNLNLNGQTLTLLSSNTGGPLNEGYQARVIQSGNFAVVGTTAVVQRAITNPTPIGYRHYSTPVSGETVGTLATTGFTPVLNQAYNTASNPGGVTPFPNVFGYDETRLRPAASGGSPATNYSNFDKGWFVPTASTPWEVGRGYTVNISRDAVVDFAGQLNNGEIVRSGLTRTVADGGWHLLGNPYPEPISMMNATRSSDPNDPTANLAGMDAAIYVFEATSQYGGTYRSAVNGIGGTAVEVAQGFFARTSAVGTAGTVRFTNDLRGSGGSNQFRQQAETRPLLRLNVADAARTLADNAVVYFEANATNSYDATADAYKLTNPSGLTLGTVLANGEALSIDGRPVLGSQAQIIPLNLAVPRAGTYTFSVGSLLNLNGTTVTLRDALTGTRTALTAATVYSFRTSGTSANGRFTLEFQPAAAPLATAAQALAAQVQVYPNPASGSFQLALPVSAKGGVATLTNALGQTVLTRTLTGAETTFDVRTLAAGVYQLHLNVEGTKVVRRVVVK